MNLDQQNEQQPQCECRVADMRTDWTNRLILECQKCRQRWYFVDGLTRKLPEVKA
jgi:hypothetical protein